MTTAHDKLADWILSRGLVECSHLKLQKLVFYCYGIVSALDEGSRAELGEIAFHAWTHGPVNVSLFYRIRGEGLSPRNSPSYSSKATSNLQDVLSVYGHLSAWELREQSHLESPWKETPQSMVINDDTIVNHFRAKFVSGAVRAPEYVSGEWSVNIDGIPARRYTTFGQLAGNIRAITQKAAAM